MKNGDKTKPKPERENRQSVLLPNKDVLREPGQISFKDALKKAIINQPKKNDK